LKYVDNLLEMKYSIFVVNEIDNFSKGDFKMKFGQRVCVTKGKNHYVYGIITGMKGKKVKVKQDHYYGIEKIDQECFNGVWVSRSQIMA